MSWDVIRGCGKIFKHDGLNKDGKGLRTTKSMLEEFVVQFAKRTKKYFDATGGDLPYIYRERQLSSIVLLALDEVCDAVSAEALTIRNAEEGKYGWVDYWVLKGKSTTILIELKHAYEAFMSNTDVKPETTSRFGTAIKQIENIKAADFKNDTNLVGLALMIITAYTQTKKDVSVSKETAQQSLESIVSGLRQKQQITFAATWYVPEEMRGKFQYANEREEFYPFVHFIAFAKELE